MGTYQALWVTETPQFQQKVVERSLDELPDNEVLIRVRYSSLNYKDALSATGNRGVTLVNSHIHQVLMPPERLLSPKSLNLSKAIK